jgi:hypothetical protein
MPWNTSRRNFIAGSAVSGALGARPQASAIPAAPISPPLVRARAPQPHLGLPIGPLSLDQMTRDTWGIFDPLVIAKLGPLAQMDCYQHKFYKSPLVTQEVLPPFGYITQTLRITPGSILYGIYLPALTFVAPLWNIQITDKSGTEDYTLFDQPTPAFFLANLRITYQSNLPPAPPPPAAPTRQAFGSSPWFFSDPYAITGNGLLLVQLWETSGQTQRIEVVFGVLELVA